MKFFVPFLLSIFLAHSAFHPPHYEISSLERRPAERFILGFFSKSAPPTGHVFVAWHQIHKTGKITNHATRGFYPLNREKILLMSRGVAGRIGNESNTKLSEITASVLVEVDKAIFFGSLDQTKKMMGKNIEFTLFNFDCISFLEEIIDYSKLLRPERSIITTPTSYIISIAKLNAAKNDSYVQHLSKKDLQRFM